MKESDCMWLHNAYNNIIRSQLSQQTTVNIKMKALYALKYTYSCISIQRLKSVIA